jgi:hypothetical protein
MLRSFPRAFADHSTRAHSVQPRCRLDGKAVTLLKVQLATSALAELRGGEREHAAKLLVDLARR